MSAPRSGAASCSSVTPHERNPGYMGAESLWEPHTPVRSDPPTPPTPPPAPPTTGAPGRRRWCRRPMAVGGLALSLLLATGLGLMYMASERLGDNVARVQNAF